MVQVSRHGNKTFIALLSRFWKPDGMNHKDKGKMDNDLQLKCPHANCCVCCYVVISDPKLPCFDQPVTHVVHFMNLNTV